MLWNVYVERPRRLIKLVTHFSKGFVFSRPICQSTRVMAAKAITEASGKMMLGRHLGKESGVVPPRTASVTEATKWDALLQENSWLESERLVVKVDQGVKRRGKHGLVALDTDLSSARAWIEERLGTEVKVGSVTGVLRSFIIEPFVAHEQGDEAYVAVFSQRDHDAVLFSAKGGMDMGEGAEKKSLRMDVPVGKEISADEVESSLLKDIKGERRKLVSNFIVQLYKAYVDLYFTYLEINPLLVTEDAVHMTDLAAKVDTTAEFVARSLWGPIVFPPSFGREALPEEKYIEELDASTGASLKLTVLNPKGRIWTLVAGGGASVIYCDTVAKLGGAKELANYGEYSGAPSEQQTYDYARTILSLMTKGSVNPEGKVLIIGGGIANFTNVAKTFKGIVSALREYQTELVEHKISIFVRRGGPNYQEGLRLMRELGENMGVPLHVFGPETHMTAVVGMALGTTPLPDATELGSNAQFLLPSGQSEDCHKKHKENKKKGKKEEVEDKRESEENGKSLFSAQTKSIVWGLQLKAIQSMLDFDYVCCRKDPSVSAIVYPFGGDHKQRFYWGHSQVLIPVYKMMANAMANHPEADVVVNFASFRSAIPVTNEVMGYPQIRTIAIIAEGIPENMTRKLILDAKEKGVVIIGPATVGGLRPGSFKIGNTGGMMDNILESKLYRPGSVAYVSRSGGLSNELNNIVSQATNGVMEGVAIGGDRYPGTTFLDHLMRYEADPKVKLLLLLGEVGGVEEYRVCEALKKKKITKPLIAWCIGTCAAVFSTDVQFGHAGAQAASTLETSAEKNKALAEAGAHVPESFDQLPELLSSVYKQLVDDGTIKPKKEVPPPPMPMDYSWARELGLIRKPTSFLTSVSDERGQEVLYANVPISDVLSEKLGVGGVLALLWFQRRLPTYVCDFFEMCLMLTADHGPAVSGAHNTIVCARAGKDLISSLTSGLLTIGDRFGGALDAAAKQFSHAFDTGLEPADFVACMRKEGKLVMGIGHRVKSITNPDRRVFVVRDYVEKNFPAAPLLKYALAVERVTTAKKPNLILNVDGIIAVTFVDLLRCSGCFTSEEAEDYIAMGSVNGFFVLGRTIGFIAHFLDQKRLRQGLYRHPWDDISYLIPDHSDCID